MSRTTSSAISPTTSTTPSRAPRKRAGSRATSRAAASQAALLRAAARHRCATSSARTSPSRRGPSRSARPTPPKRAAGRGRDALRPDLFELPAGPVGFSLGAEWRYASSQFMPDEFLRSGDVVGFNPGLPTEGDVTAKEMFGEVRMPILGGQPFVDDLTANGAFRMSDYDLDGVGDVWTYLYGLDWRWMKTSRSAVNIQRAIRAPNVAELYGGLRRSVEPATDPCSEPPAGLRQTAAVRALCVASGVPAASVFTAGVQPNNIIPALFGGNPNVGEEGRTLARSVSSSRRRSLPQAGGELDYFDISLDGAIAQLGGGLEQHAEPLLQHHSGRQQRVLPGDQPQSGDRRDQRSVLRRDPPGEHRWAGNVRLRFLGALRLRLRLGPVRRRQHAEHQHGVDAHQRVHVDAGAGVPEREEPLRRLLWHHLRRADSRVQGRDALHLDHRTAEPEPAASISTM